MESQTTNRYIVASRRKRALSNVVISLIFEALLVIAGVFLPRAVLKNFGDEINGVVNSAQQIFNYILLFEVGIYGATTVALYKPMANNDQNKINAICYSAQRLFRIIGLGVFIFSIGFAFVFPLFANQETLNYWDFFIIVIAISINALSEIFFVAKYSAIFMAAQRNSLVSILKCSFNILYYIIVIILSYTHISAVYAYLIASSVFVVKSLLFYFVCKKFFPDISFRQNKTKTKLGQSADAVLHSILNTVCLNSTMVILPLVGASMANVISVYTIYNLVMVSLFAVVSQVLNSVLTAFGNLNAAEESRVKTVYREFHSIFQILWSVMMSCLIVLFTPFVTLYTFGIETEVVYVDWGVAILGMIIVGLYTIRNEQTVVLSARGEFKQMRLGGILETVFTFAFSIGGYFLGILLAKQTNLPDYQIQLWGLKGLLIGRATALLYRFVEIIILNNKSYNCDSLKHTLKEIGISLLSISIVTTIFYVITHFYHLPEKWLAWIILAFITGITSGILTLLLWFIFDRPYFQIIIQKIIGFFKRKSNKNKTEIGETISQEDKKKNKKFYIWFFTIIACFLLLIGSLTAVSLFNNRQNEDGFAISDGEPNNRLSNSISYYINRQNWDLYYRGHNWEKRGNIVYLNGVTSSAEKISQIYHLFQEHNPFYDCSYEIFLDDLKNGVFFSKDPRTVRFYQEDQTTLLYETKVDLLDEAIYPYELPIKEMEGEYLYPFYSWSNDIKQIHNNIDVFPIYYPIRYYDALYLEKDAYYSVIIKNNISSYITDIKIPEQYEDKPILSISKNGFINMDNLKHVTLPNSLISINSYAFANLKNFQTIHIPNNVLNIGELAFHDCPNLTIYCAMSSKPANWDEHWCDENINVVWGDIDG